MSIECNTHSTHVHTCTHMYIHTSETTHTQDVNMYIHPTMYLVVYMQVCINSVGWAYNIPYSTYHRLIHPRPSLSPSERGRAVGREGDREGEGRGREGGGTWVYLYYYKRMHGVYTYVHKNM